MSHDTHNSNGHGSFERRDIGIGGVIYFLAGLAIFMVITYVLINGLYSFLQKQTTAQEPPVSPLAKSVPEDTRHLPAGYKTDSESADYEKYLRKNFPSPQLETDERTQLEKIRQYENQVLSTYDYVDQNAGTVRIPIERAMDLIAQRGLLVRSQSGDQAVVANVGSKEKGTKK